MPVHALASMTWTAVRDLAATTRVVAVLPVGAIEAHGPHLPLGTDLIIAGAMAEAGADRLSERGFEVLLLPALPFTPAPFAADFAGTLHTPAEATTQTVAGIARSLAAHGVETMVIANAHHDPANVEALRSAVARTAQEGCGTLVFPDLTRRRWAAKLTPEFQSGACHAGRCQTSIVLAAEPTAVRRDLLPGLPPNPRSLVDAIRSGQQTFGEAGGANAYFGAPAEATEEEGRQIIAMLGAVIEEAVLEAVTVQHGEAP